MLKVYMLGSGPIAVPVLKKLLQQSREGAFELVGVGTQPDRPAGRKRTLMPTPVGACALENNIAIDKFENLNDPAVVEHIKALSPDFLLVVSYGQLLKKPLLELPRYGCVNIHASLLPRYRGASPITQAIVNRDATSGVCFMDMEIGLDSGKVYKTLTRKLDNTEYADVLEVELGYMAADETLSVLEDIAQGVLPGVPQDPELVTMTGKLKKSDGIIDWNQDAIAIEAMVRAYTPWPGAIFTLELNGELKNLVITRATVTENESNLPGGTIIRADRKKFVIACGKGALEINELIPPGKKAMSGADFLNGSREPLAGRKVVQVDDV